MTLMRWIAVAYLVLASTHCFGASFDCANAASAIEHRICANTELSELDGALATAYMAAIAAAEEPGKRDLQVEQRHWITFVRNVCESDACLSSSYRQRIKVLAENHRTIVNESSCDIPEGKSCRSVVVYRDTSYRLASFNQSLRSQRHPGKFIGCDRLIDLPVGFNGSNHSFGAYCTLESTGGRKRLKVCNDDMTGRFALEPITTGTDSELRDFTNAHCFGG